MHTRIEKLHHAQERYKKFWAFEKASILFLIIMLALYITGTLGKLGALGIILMGLSGLCSSVVFIFAIVVFIDRLRVSHWKRQIRNLYDNNNFEEYIPSQYKHW